MHSQYSLLESSKAGQNVLECVSPNDCLLVVMNPSFVAWQLFVLAGLGGKAKTFLLRRFEAETVLELIEQELITILPLIPTMWRMLMDSSPEDCDLTSLRLASVGGESPSAALVERLRSVICDRIVGTYMASESGTASTIVVRTEDIIVHNKAGSTGLPTLGADMKIIDPDGDIDDEMSVGETGEITVSSPSLAMGYWREPDLTAKKFVRGWWRSGDLGRIDNRWLSLGRWSCRQRHQYGRDQGIRGRSRGSPRSSPSGPALRRRRTRRQQVRPAHRSLHHRERSRTYGRNSRPISQRGTKAERSQGPKGLQFPFRTADWIDG